MTQEATRLRLNLLLKEGAVTSKVHYRPKRNMWQRVPGFIPPMVPVQSNKSTMALVKQHMSMVYFRSAAELAPLFDTSTQEMARKLVRLHGHRVVEKMQDPTSPNQKFLWRMVPEGYIASIYDAQPGVCGRALDEVLGGHMYLKANSNVEHQCSIRHR